MELNLKREKHNYYEPLAFAPFACETMREHIVPDSCADIARIVETTGQVYVTNREISGDGRLNISGSIDISVLYIPEKGDGPCSLHFQLPFQCCTEIHWGEENEFLDVCGELQNVDARLLNPRKILIRANVMLCPSGCRHMMLSVCTEAQGDDSIQTLCDQRETRVIAAIREKEFSFLEELPLSPGRGGADELISSRVEIRGTDCKLIGSKLVVKGVIAATVLYRERDGGLEQTHHELPFSQILDGNGLEEEWESESLYRLLSAECRIGEENGGDDRHILTLTLLLRARVIVWRTEKIQFIADLYSTAGETSCATEELVLRENSQRYTRRQNLREVLESGTAVKTVLDTEVGCGGVRRGSEVGVLEIPVWGRCLYLDENDSLHSIRKEWTAVCQSDQEDDVRVDSWASCRGDVMASILPDGIELRFPLECTMEAVKVHRHLCVSGGMLNDEDNEEKEKPSLILRKIGREEMLWSVAKHYRTTCRAILEVNELADERQIPRDRLLLIPRCR